MSVIPMRRLQQAVWSGLSQANRAAGSGGGSGLQSLPLLGTASTGSVGSPAGPTNWVPSGTTVTFQVGFTTRILAMAISPGYMVPAGAPGAHDCIVQLKLDGVVQTGIQNATGLISQVAGVGTFGQYANVNIAQVFLLAPGSHTIAPNFNIVAGDSIQLYNAVTYVFQTLG